MNIKDFTEGEIEYLLSRCNFVNEEKPLFLMRARGIPIERIAEELEMSYSNARKLSQKVNKKIIKSL